MKLAHPRIVTTNVRKLAKFYESMTGVSPEGGDDYLVFELPGGALAISSAEMMQRHGAGAAQPKENRSMVLDFEVDDVDDQQARIRESGGELVQAPTTQPWGNRSMLFRDPDGNLINFYTRTRVAEKVASEGNGNN